LTALIETAAASQA